MDAPDAAAAEVALTQQALRIGFLRVLAHTAHILDILIRFILL